MQERGRAAAAEKGAQSSRMAAQQAMYLQYNLVNVANAAIASRGNLIAMASPMIDVGMNMGLLSMRGLAAAAGIGAVTVAVGGLIWYAESSDRRCAASRWRCRRWAPRGRSCAARSRP